MSLGPAPDPAPHFGFPYGKRLGCRELLGKIEDESLKEFIEHLHKDILFGKNDEKFESIVARHLKLLSESGYIKGIQYGCTLPGKVSYVRIEPELTMAGYDLLEVLRSKTVWRSK